MWTVECILNMWTVECILYINVKVNHISFHKTMGMTIFIGHQHLARDTINGNYIHVHTCTTCMWIVNCVNMRCCQSQVSVNACQCVRMHDQFSLDIKSGQSQERGYVYHIIVIYYSSLCWWSYGRYMYI